MRHLLLLTLLVSLAIGAQPTLEDSWSGSETSNTTNPLLTLNSLTSGWEVICIIGNDGASQPNDRVETVAGFTLIGVREENSNTANISAWQRTATGSEGGTADIDTNDESTEEFAWHCYAFSSADGANVENADTENSTGAPNPPSHTPTDTSPNCTYIAVTVNDNGDQDYDTWSSGYTLGPNSGETHTGGAPGIGIASAYKESSSGCGTENPGSFGMVTETEQWTGMTIHVPVAAASGINSGVMRYRRTQ